MSFKVRGFLSKSPYNPCIKTISTNTRYVACVQDGGEGSLFSFADVPYILETLEFFGVWAICIFTRPVDTGGRGQGALLLPIIRLGFI